MLTERDLEIKFTEMIDENPEIKLIDALEKINMDILSKNSWCGPDVELVLIKFTEIVDENPEIKFIDVLEKLHIHVLSKSCWCNPDVELVHASA